MIVLEVDTRAIESEKVSALGLTSVRKRIVSRGGKLEVSAASASDHNIIRSTELGRTILENS